jgi:group I intron endonuclease
MNNKISGIYKIQSQKNKNRIYIGSAKNIHVRWGIHISCLRRNKHHSIKLQNHYNKYGESDLLFSILLGCDESCLISNEQFFIDSYKPFFNIKPKAGSNLGFKHSDECKNKIRQSLIGKKHSEERRKNISIASKGRIVSEKTRQKMSISRKGHDVGENTREKIRNTLTGVKHTEERKLNSSIGHLGQKSWLKGKRMSDESRIKMSIAKKGKIAWNKNRKFINGKYELCPN